MLVQVSPSFNIYEPLTYNYPGRAGELKPGHRVIIPLGKQVTSGWVIDESPACGYKGQVRDIIGVVKDEYVPDAHYLDFARSLAQVYFVSMGLILDRSLPPGRRALTNLYFAAIGEQGKIKRLNRYSLPELQELSKDAAVDFFYKPGPGSEPGDRFPIQPLHQPGEYRLLVGYHRLDDYRQISAHHLERNESVLITVPDNMTADYLKKNLDGADVYHSEIKAKERERLWQEYWQGKSGVVIGGLSAVLLPIKNLGAVICDRAGSGLYKRSRFSKFNINHLARLRAEKYGVPFIEGFSSCTVEFFCSKNQLLVEDKREEEENTPVAVRMLTQKGKGIPDELIGLLKNYFIENKRILIILNRKVGADFFYCQKCRKIHKCPVCSGMVKIIKGVGSRCLRCGFEPRVFDRCQKCGGSLVTIEDIGFAALEKIIQREITEKGIFSLSAEELTDAAAIRKEIAQSKIVVSTPVIVNPYFKDLFDAVVYVRPESLFSMEDYRAAEMIFSLVSELRELVKKRGTIDVFSAFHFHYALQLINDEQGFFERELKYRQWFLLPPFANVYHIEIKAADLRPLGQEMRSIYEKFKVPLGFKRIYLSSRKKIRGNYIGIIEAHAQPKAIQASGLLKKRNLTIAPVMI